MMSLRRRPNRCGLMARHGMGPSAHPFRHPLPGMASSPAGRVPSCATRRAFFRGAPGLADLFTKRRSRDFRLIFEPLGQQQQCAMQ